MPLLDTKLPGIDQGRESEILEPQRSLRFRLSRKLTRLCERMHFRGSGRLRSLLAQLLLQRPKGSMVLRSDLGFLLLIDPIRDSGVEHDIYYFGAYEPGTVQVMQQCVSAGETALDIGGNIGYLALLLQQLVGENGSVFTFEASSETAEILKKNVSLNRLKNVVVENVALGSAKGLARFYANINVNRGSASFFNQSSKEQGDEIPIIPVDSFLQERNIQQVAFVKIDVEGWELEVLKGAKRLLSSSTPPVLCVEFCQLHPLFGGSHADLYHFIRSANNYRLFKLRGTKERSSLLTEILEESQIPYNDNVFCFPSHFNFRRLLIDA